MQNWYCLINFPDGSQSTELVPGPAPMPAVDGTAAIIKITSHPGIWRVRDVTREASSPREYAAQIWVEKA